MSGKPEAHAVGGLCTGLAIVAVAFAIVGQRLLFDGDRLTPLGASLLGFWQGLF